MMAVQLNTIIEKMISTSHTMNKMLVSAERHFFATSHRKGPADGIGGTVKRLAAKTSLQKVYNSQIQTTHEQFNYCNRNIHITCFCVQEEQILNKKKGLAE
jgi:hypothetical protein